MRQRLSHLAALGVASSAFFVIPSRGAPGARDSDPMRFGAAHRLARGDGVGVAVIGTDISLARIIERLAPGARVRSHALAPPAPSAPPPTRSRRRVRESRDGEHVAQALDQAIGDGARVVLLSMTRADDDDEDTRAAIGRAVGAGVLLLAPTGDEGLSYERAPARTLGVLGVAALASRALAPLANVGARTPLAAPGASSSEAAARVAAAAALALSFDPALTRDEVARALESGEPVGPVREGGGPSRVDALDLIEAVRPRCRRVVLRDLRVVPRFVPRGQPASLRARILSVGRLGVSGPLVVSVEGLRDVVVPFGPLAPGQSVELDARFVPRPLHEPHPLRLPDEGLIEASPVLAIARTADATASVALDVVPGHEKPPWCRLVDVAAEDGLRVVVMVENGGVVAETDLIARLRRADGAVLAEMPCDPVEPGARARIELAGAIEGDRRQELVHALVELVRSPRGFHETVADRRSLVLDPRGAPAARRAARR